MTREQAKQKLISFGVAEPTDEQISDLLNSVNAETKKEKETEKKSQNLISIMSFDHTCILFNK